MKAKLNYSRFGKAYSGRCYDFGLFLNQERVWPVRRCSICGKMERPGEQFIGQVNPFPPRYICHDHGGKLGSIIVDCFTGCEVKVGPEPDIIWKVITDPMKESLFWIWVLIKYAWLTAKDTVLNVLYWRRIRKANRAWQEILEEMSDEEE